MFIFVSYDGNVKGDTKAALMAQGWRKDVNSELGAEKWVLNCGRSFENYVSLLQALDLCCNEVWN